MHNTPLYADSSSPAQGRYIPAFASYVYDANARLIEAGATPINLDSIMIGESRLFTGSCSNIDVENRKWLLSGLDYASILLRDAMPTKVSCTCC